MKKVIKICLIAVIMILIIWYLCFCFLKFLWKDGFHQFDYNSSKEDATKFLNENIDELNKLAHNYLENHELKSKKFKIVTNIGYKKIDELEYIQFDCDAQGMLGGQYWGLLYIPSNTYLQEDLYIYNEREIDNNGNNIFIREKIIDYWFFYYDDYDGKVDIKKIK